MIKVENVSLKLNKFDILNNISIEIKQGEAVGLVGGNGSGKTMLMKCICGFNTSFSGEITVDEKKIGKDTSFPENMGFMIESPGFVSYMSGFDNLMALANIRKKISKEVVRDYLEIVGLDPFSKKSVKKYSLGMRQRLGIAQALMEDPDLLILDEPFNGLDKEMVQKIRGVLVKEKEKGKTIILASHNEKDIEYICDRTYVIDAGKIIGEN